MADNKTTSALYSDAPSIEAQRKNLLADLAEFISEDFRPGVDRRFNALVFLGAHPADLRGVSDAGLSDDELAEVVAHLDPGSTWFGPICDHLEAAE